MESSKTYPVQSSTLRVNGHAMIKGQPCKVVQLSTSKPGKHGHAKVSMVGIGIFTGKKYVDVCPTSHNVEVPVVKKTDYLVVDVGSMFLSLLDDEGHLRSDLRMPDGDLQNELRAKFNSPIEDKSLAVSVLQAMDEERVVSVKFIN